MGTIALPARILATVATVALAMSLLVGAAAAHDTSVQGDGGVDPDAADVYVRASLSGHDPDTPSVGGPGAVAQGFEHVSTFSFDFDGDGVIDTGIGSVTDIWEHDGYAYLGTFYEPDCSRFGTRIVDISDPADPTFVGNLKSMPNTRVNDVKVHAMDNAWFSGDLLAATQEPCFLARGDGVTRENKGGVVLYDVTDPSDPVLVKKAYIAGQTGTGTNFGVHNTYFWDHGGSTYLAVVDDNNLRDFHILDVTKPENPVEVSVTGWPDWLDATTDPQGATGSAFLHDIWVEEHDGTMIAYLSYWDAGLILLDVTDPADPTLIGDSDYDLTGPEGDAVGEEGNGHVAVPAPTEDGRYVLLGDEDFTAYRSSATYTPAGETPVEVTTIEGDFTTPLASFDPDPLPAEIVSAQGTLCVQNGIDFSGRIALIERGGCTFQLKADNAEAQGAIGFIVYNHVAGGESLVLMGGNASGLFGFFLPRSTGLAIEQALTQGAVTFNIQQFFSGWGYLRVIDTRPAGGGAKFTEVASFATPLTFEPDLLPGDYTMHNVVMGPAGTAWADTAFISWYSDGMVALDVSDPTAPAWTGHWIGCSVEHADDCDATLDSAGNPQAAATNLWGVYPTVIDGEVYVLGSDRNNGLVILKPVAGASVPGALAPGGGNTP